MHLRLAAALLGAAALGIVYPRPAGAEEPPHLDPDLPVQCLTDGDGRVWRVQCSDPEDPGTKAKVCVYAPNREIDADGNWGRELERVRSCSSDGPFDQDALRAEGYTLIAGVADAPYGWLRDRRGAVYQVKFDLHKRLYIGVSWAPSGGEQLATSTSRTLLDFELLELEHTGAPGRLGTFRHRVRIAQGEVQLAPFGADATVLHYDVSRRYPYPILRVTTFFGKPRRHDIDAHIGLWFEAAHVSISEPAPGQRETLWRYATLHLTWDLWRSADMASFVRVRGGAGVDASFGEDALNDRQAITPGAAAEADLTLDRSGFNHVTASVEVERPIHLERPDSVPERGRRVKATVGYERVLIALNDQPLSLRFAGEARRRDDVPGVTPGWEYRASAGLRFSLWAPAPQKPATRAKK